MQKMTCLNPIHAWQRQIFPNTKDEKERKYYNKLSFKYREGWKHLELPCGKCLACKLDHSSMWGQRIMLEAKQWKYNCFITLTYNDKGHRKNGERNLPTSKGGIPTLKQNDVQRFLKRLRKAYQGIEEWKNPKTGKIEKPIRYFYCGEYGTKNLRPHYHIAILNWCPDDLKFYKPSPKTNEPLYTSKKLEKLWTYGFCPIGQLTYKSANYIARYIMKKAYKPHPEVLDQEPEFIQMSRNPGIGIMEWKNNKNILKKSGTILFNNDGVKAKPLPRYFLKLWEKENMTEYDTYRYKKQQEMEKQQELINKQLNYPGREEDQKWQHNNTLMTLLKDKAKLLKRNL